jgi:hypothetical protein
MRQIEWRLRALERAARPNSGLQIWFKMDDGTFRGPDGEQCSEDTFLEITATQNVLLLDEVDFRA